MLAEITQVEKWINLSEQMILGNVVFQVTLIKQRVLIRQLLPHPFMERALPVEAFAPSRRLGIGGHSHSDGGLNWTAGYGVFGDSVNADNNDGSNEGSGTAVRLTMAPIAEKGRVVHFGGYGE